MKDACKLFYLNLHIRLSSIQLYKAKNSRISELLKVIDLLVEARKLANKNYRQTSNEINLDLTESQLSILKDITINEINVRGKNANIMKSFILITNHND